MIVRPLDTRQCPVRCVEFLPSDTEQLFDFLLERAVFVGDDAVHSRQHGLSSFESLPVALALGDVLEVDGEAGRRGKRTHLEPAPERFVKLLEADRLLCLDDVAVLLPEPRVFEAVDNVPDYRSTQVVDGSSAVCDSVHEVPALLVEVGELPVGVDGEEGVSHPVERRLSLGVLYHHSAHLGDEFLVARRALRPLLVGVDALGHRRGRQRLRPVSRRQDDRQPGPTLSDCPNEVDAASVRQFAVGDQTVDSGVGHRGACRRHRVGGQHVDCVVRALDARTEGVPGTAVAIDDENTNLAVTRTLHLTSVDGENGCTFRPFSQI